MLEENCRKKQDSKGLEQIQWAMYLPSLNPVTPVWLKEKNIYNFKKSHLFFKVRHNILYSL